LLHCAIGRRVRAAAASLGKTSARFVPGLNVAIAALDTANAAATIADPKASAGKKITAGVTAVASIVSATNVPILSQIGAGVSGVSSVVGAFV
jgi:hypothetical protein